MQTTAESTEPPGEIGTITFRTGIEDRPEVSRFWVWQAPLAFAIVMIITRYAVPWFSSQVLLAEGWGPVEFSHIVIPIVGAVFAAMAIREAGRKVGWELKALLLALLLGCVYIAGEEASWGQMLVHWDTPEFWAELNRQQETNLHNTSTWANHKPRAVLEIAIFLGTIVFPLAFSRNLLTGIRNNFAMVLPGRSCWPVGWLATLYVLWQHVEKIVWLPDIASRASEIQETFVYSFVAIYAITLRNRLRRARA